MIRQFFCVLAVAICTIAAAGTSSAIHVAGGGVKATDWTIDQLRSTLASEIKPIEYNSKGAKHTFSCVPLASVLKAAGVGTDFAMKGGADPKTKNPQMRVAVMVHGIDGYGAVFSLAEILPMVGNRAVWLALDEDGKPLADNDGPTRLIVPDDGMPARGVHQVASIEIIDLGSATTQPAAP
jgi:hypothetical protein